MEIDRLLSRHERLDHRPLGTEARPRLRTVVVTCMDCRIDPVALLDLSPGEVHVLRNAGGVVTEDVVRSIAVSQAALGTREVILIQHTGCGMCGVDDSALRDLVAESSGARPDFPLHPFDDVRRSVREGLAALRASPVLTHRDRLRGFVLDIATGALEEVSPAATG